MYPLLRLVSLQLEPAHGCRSPIPTTPLSWRPTITACRRLERVQHSCDISPCYGVRESRRERRETAHRHRRRRSCLGSCLGSCRSGRSRSTVNLKIVERRRGKPLASVVRLVRQHAAPVVLCASPSLSRRLYDSTSA